MDFTNFDAVKAATGGAWMHVKHPASGNLLYGTGADGTKDVDKPCRIKVLGSEAPSAQTTLRKLQKARARDDQAKIKSQTEIHQELCDIATPLITEFENIDRGDRAATVDDIAWFLNLQITNGQADEKSFAEQTVEFAFKRASFLGNDPQS